MDNPIIELKPSDLDGLTAEANFHSIASSRLSVKLAGGLEMVFFGSLNETMFAETFFLRNDAGKAFHFSPGEIEKILRQIKEAVASGYTKFSRDVRN